MVGPKRKEDRTLVVRLGPGDLAHNVLTHSRDTNGQRSTAELELKLGIIGEPFNSVSVDEITKSAIQEWLLDQSEERDWSPATQNRYHAAFSLVFRVSFESKRLGNNSVPLNSSTCPLAFTPQIWSPKPAEICTSVA
jgi:hypothetical protein